MPCPASLSTDEDSFARGKAFPGISSPLSLDTCIRVRISKIHPKIEWLRCLQVKASCNIGVKPFPLLHASEKHGKITGRCSVIHVDVDPLKHLYAPGLLEFKEMHLEPKGE